MGQRQTQLEQRIEQVSQEADRAIDAYNAALSKVMANARQTWKRLTDHDLIILAQQQEAWLYGRLPQAGDAHSTVLEAPARATEMRMRKARSCGYDQVIKLLDRLAALVSQRKIPQQIIEHEREEGIA